MTPLYVSVRHFLNSCVVVPALDYKQVASFMALVEACQDYELENGIPPYNPDDDEWLKSLG